MSYQPSLSSEAKASSCIKNGRRNIDIDAAAAAVAMTSMNQNTTNHSNSTTTVGTCHSHRRPRQPAATTVTTTTSSSSQQQQQKQQEQLVGVLQQLLQSGGSSHAGIATAFSQVQQLSNLLGVSIAMPSPIPQQQQIQQRNHHQSGGQQPPMAASASTASEAVSTLPLSSKQDIPAVDAKAVVETTSATTTATTKQSFPFCQAVGGLAVDGGTKNDKKKGKNEMQQRKLSSSSSSSPMVPMISSSKQNSGSSDDDTMSDYCNDEDEDGKIGSKNMNSAKTTAIQVASTYVTALEVAGEGSRIAPCHARGMPKTHNAKTAFFVLYKGTKHGEALLCSHKACSERGVRFVFCSICDQPVAVGNFTSRHSHKDVLANDKDTKATGSKDCRRTSSKAEKLHKKRKQSSSLSKSLLSRGRLPPKKQKTRLSSHDMHRKQSINMSVNDDKIAAPMEVAQSSLYYAESCGVNDGGGPNVVQNTGSNADSAESLNSSSSSSSSSSYEAVSAEEYGGMAKRGRDMSSVDDVVPSSTVIPVGGDDYKKQNKRLVSTRAHNVEDNNRKKRGSNNREMRVEMWLKLLSTRPRDTKGDEMSAWLMAAVAVSDPEADVVSNVGVQRFMRSFED